MKMNPSFWLSLFFAACMGIAVATAMQWPWDTRLFPWAVGIPALFMALWQLILDLRSSQENGGSEEGATTQILDIPTDQSIPGEVARRRTAVAFGWIFSFVFSIWLVGLLIAAPLFVFFYLWYQASARIRVSAGIAGLTTIFIWGLFDQVMHVAWPEPMILRLLGF